jgi:tetratricopeptide (TPR) repeat protein
MIPRLTRGIAVVVCALGCALEIAANEPPDEGLGEAERLSNKGALLAQQGRYDEAVALLREATDLDPLFQAAWYNLALTRERTENWADAAAGFETAVSLRPDHADAWFHLGLARSRLGHHKDAVVALFHSLELAPEDARPLVQLGYEAWRLEKWESAIENWERFLNDFDDHPSRPQIRQELPGAYYNLGGDHHNQGRTGPAIEAYEAAIRLRPEYPEALHNLGIVLQEVGTFAKADSVLRDARSLDPSNPDLLTTSGTVAARLDSLEGADVYFRKALKLSPGHVGARRGLVDLHVRTGRIGDATQEVQDLIRKSPKDPQLHALLAFIYEHNDKGERYGAGYAAADAGRAYRTALGLAPQTPEYHYSLGVVLGRSEDWTGARAEFQRVLAIDSTHAGVSKWLPVIEANIEASIRETDPN